VRDVADEIAADRFQAPDAGQVLEDDQVALGIAFFDGPALSVAERAGDGLQKQPMPADFDGFYPLFPQFAVLLPQLDEGMVRFAASVTVYPEKGKFAPSTFWEVGVYSTRWGVGNEESGCL
jgi:hypothetical protein